MIISLELKRNKKGSRSRIIKSVPLMFLVVEVGILCKNAVSISNVSTKFLSYIGDLLNIHVSKFRADNNSHTPTSRKGKHQDHQ